MLRFQDTGGVVFDVTTLRDISRLPFFAAAELGRSAVDVASPEYNGPIVAGAPADAAELVARYRKAVDSALQDLGAVTEFVRCDPFAAATSGLGAIEELTSVSEVVYVDVREGYETAFRGYRPEHRTAIRKAVRAGTEVRFVAAPGPDALDRFFALYTATLARKPDVKSYHKLPLDYFASLFRHLGEHALLVESWSTGRLASSTVFVVGARRAWYLYGGTQPEAVAGGANKLLFDRVIAWAAEQRLEALVLCGGFEPGDGLYQFKRGYSKLSARIAQLRKVHDAAALERLERAKAEFDRERGRATRRDYFPSYWLE